MSDAGDLSLEREKTKLERYLIKKERGQFIEDVLKMGATELNQKMLGLAKHREEIRNTKAEDAELIEATEKKKSLEAPYREQLRMNEKLTRFVAIVMKDQGVE